MPDPKQRQSKEVQSENPGPEVRPTEEQVRKVEAALAAEQTVKSVADLVKVADSAGVQTLQEDMSYSTETLFRAKICGLVFQVLNGGLSMPEARKAMQGLLEVPGEQKAAVIEQGRKDLEKLRQISEAVYQEFQTITI